LLVSTIDFMTNQLTDEIIASGRWVFDTEVATAIDDMHVRSIPQYDVMRRLVLEVGTPFVRDGSWIIDLGCGQGDSLAGFVERFGAAVHYLGVDESRPMLGGAVERFGSRIDDMTESPGRPVLLNGDLRDGFPRRPASLALLVLALQFVPLERRQRLVRSVYETLEPGGALVLVEKVLGATAAIDDLFVRVYYDRKRAAGYTEEQIQAKRVSLQGVLVPLTVAWNEELLTEAGFAQVDAFWRWCNFAGWIAVKAA
jgi:tRNA (cmo5U34)-methyltransferase